MGRIYPPLFLKPLKNTNDRKQQISPSLLKVIKLASSGQYEHAINAINNIRKENRENPIFFNTLGIIYRRLKKYREAEKACKKALFLKPDFIQAEVNLASVYLERENLNDATALLELV